MTKKNIFRLIVCCFVANLLTLTVAKSTGIANVSGTFTNYLLSERDPLLGPLVLAVDTQCASQCCGGSVSGACNCATGVVVVGGVPPFLYIWSNGGTTACVSGLCPGAYIVTVTDGSGNSGTLQILVGGGPCCKIKCPNDTTICFQTPDSLVNLHKPAFYSLNPSAPNPCIADSVWNNSTGVYPVGTTVITWYVRFIDGSIDSCKQNVIRNPLVPLNISFTTSPAAIAGVINICNGQSITFTNTSTGSTGQLWNFGNGYYSSNVTHTQVYTFPPGTYTVKLTVYDACGFGHDTTLTVIVDPNAGPDIECISVVCAGDTATYHTNANCTTYNWTVTGGVFSPPPTTSSTSVTVIWGPGPTGTISLSVSGCTPPNTCSVATVKTVHIVPSTMPVKGNTIVCAGSKTCYGIDCIPGNVHTWEIMPPTAGTITGQGTCEICIQWTPGFTGNVTIKVNYENVLTGAGCTLPDGCTGPHNCTGMGTLTIQVRPIFGISGPSKVCPNSISAPFNGMNLTTNAIAPGVSWKVITPIPTTLTFPNTGAFNGYTWNAGPGIYTVTAYPPPNIYCNDSATVNVEVVKIITPNPIQGDDTVCPNTTHFYTTQANMTGVQYVWNVTGNGSPLGTTITAANSLAVTWGPGGGTISVQQQLLASPFCLSNSTSVFNVVTYPNFTLPVINASATITCLKSIITYSIVPPTLLNNATYTWSVSPPTAGNIITSNGGNSISIQWINGAITPIKVKLKITRCYTDSVEFPVTLLALPPVPNISYTPPDPCKGSPVNFSTSSIQPFYNWSFGDASTSTLQNPVHTYSSAGNFNVQLTVTNSNGCSDTAFTTVHVDDVPVLPVITGNASVCVNSFGTYSFSQPFFPGASYTWSLSSGGIITSGQGSNSITVLWNSPGSHQVLLSVLSKCPAGSVTPFNVTVNSLPVAGIIIPSPSCVGSALTFTGSGGVSYSWSFPGGSPSTSNVPSPTITYGVAGTYPVSLTVTDANGCSSTTLSGIDIHELPIAFISTPSVDGCTFPFNVSLSAVNSAGYSFAWTPSGSGPTITATVNALTTFQCLVTNSFGCTALSNTITFNDGNCPPPPPGPGDCVTNDSIDFSWVPPLCLTDTFTESGSALPPFTWLFDYAGANAAGNPVNYTYTYPGVYRVQVCGTGRGFLFGTTTPCNTPICKMHPVRIPFDARFKLKALCLGNVMQVVISNNSLYLDNTGLYTWSWYLDGAGSPFSTAVNPANQAFSAGPHTVTLIISDPLNTLATCTLTVPVNVPVPIVASFTSPAQVCKGFAAAFFDTSTPSAVIRSWTSAGAPSTTTNPANLIYTVAGSTSVQLFVTDNYGCTSTASANVNVQMGTGSITVTNNGACDSVQLIASGNPNYIWTYFSPTPSVLANTVYVKQNGYYNVTATDPSNGCPYSASTPLITVKQPPVATITGKTTYCQGENYDLKTQSGGTAQWNIFPSGPVLLTGPNFNLPANVAGTFTYQVTITGINGCTATATITVVVDPVPASASIVGSPTTFCNGDSVILSVNPPGATYLWSKSPPPQLNPPVSTNPTLTVKTSGTYSVIVQTVNGCYYPAITPVTVTVNPLPPAKISGDTVLCVGETLILTTTTVGGATYVWSGPGGGGAGNLLVINNMQVSGSGVYTVTVTYTATGCSSTASINVIVHPNPVVPVIAANVPGVLCEGPLYTDSVTPGTIDGSLNLLDYVWNTGQQGYSIFVALAGNYFVTATNQWGCSSVSNVLTIHPNPDLSCTPTGCYDFCSDCDSVTIPGPFGLAAYQWQKWTGTMWANYSPLQNLKVYIPGGKFRLLGYNGFGCADSTDTLSIKFHVCCSNDTVACVDTACQYFFDNSTHNFVAYPPAPNVSIVLSNVGGQFIGDKYIRVTDGTGPSAVKADTVYDGKWCCGKFCYDFKIFNDGLPGKPNVQPQFKIYNSLINKGFLFTASFTINEDSAWKRVIACAGIDSLPVNTSMGTWTPISPAVVSDWQAVASHVTDVVFVTDVTGDNNEIVGIDNVCFIPSHFTISCQKIETCGGTTVVANVIDTGDCPTFFFKWSNGATTSYLQFVPPGTYCVTVSNCCGCVDSCCVTVLGPVDTLHVTDTIYHITCDSIWGSIHVTVGGGHPPYIFDWSNGETTQNIGHLQAGAYTLIVHDNIGCSVTVHDTVIVNANCHCNDLPPPPPPSITINSIVPDNCNHSGCIHATFTGCCLRYSYSYFPCSPQLGYSIAPTTDSSVFCNLKAGTYTLFVSDPCGNFATVNVTIPLVNGPLSASVYYSKCADTVCVIPSGGCPPYTYNWGGGATVSCRTGLAPCTDYAVTVTDSYGCAITEFVTMPGITFINVFNPTCCKLNGRICAEACFGQQPYTYVWSNGATSKCISGLGAGTYCVTVTNANGATVSCCYNLTGGIVLPPDISFHFDQCGYIVTAVINDHGCPDYTFHWENSATGLTRDNLTVCDSITLTVTMCNGAVYHHGCRVPHITAVITPVSCLTGIGSICVNTTCFGCGPLTYTWQPNPVCPGGNGPCINCAAGYYTLCITNCQGDVVCCNYFLSGLPPIVINVASQVNPTSSSPSSGSINITVSGGTPAYTYLWSNGQTTQNISGLTAGIYTVTVTDANGCTATKSVKLTVRCQLSFTTLIVQPASCYKNNGIVTVIPSGGTSYTYAWQTSPVQTTATATGLAYGVNSYVLITDISGCSILATIPVPTSLGLGVTLTSPVYNGKNVSCYGGSNGSITANVTGSTGPYTYQWSNGATTQTVTGLPAGTYSVVVSNGGCDAIAVITLTQPADIKVSITKTNPACAGGGNNGNATASATGGTSPFSYSWNTAPVQTGATATGLSTGTYTVTVTDANGCTKTGQVTLTGSSSLTVTAVVTNAKCNGSATGSIDITPAGGSPPYTYLWSTGATTQDVLNVLAAGTYTVTVTDSQGCTVSYTAVVTQPTAVTATSTSTNVSCYGGANGTACVSPSGGTPGYTYSWNTTPAKTTACVTGLKKGTYTVLITDSKGCVKPVTITITEPTLITIAISKTNVTIAGGSNGTATANVNGGIAPYSYSWSTSTGQTTQTATGLSAGTYTVTVTDGVSCTLSGSVKITAPAKAAAGAGNGEQCCSMLFPNPTTGAITVAFSEMIDSRVTFAIFNMSGQKVYEEVMQPSLNNNSFEIDLSRLAKGIYTVKYRTDERDWIDKLVIQ